jgi:hypothetical protein
MESALWGPGGEVERPIRGEGPLRSGHPAPSSNRPHGAKGHEAGLAAKGKGEDWVVLRGVVELLGPGQDPLRHGTYLPQGSRCQTIRTSSGTGVMGSSRRHQGPGTGPPVSDRSVGAGVGIGVGSMTAAASSTSWFRSLGVSENAIST